MQMFCEYWRGRYGGQGCGQQRAGGLLYSQTILRAGLRLLEKHPGSPRVPKLLILCIDDEALGLQIRKAVLERAGYRVLTAMDGSTGLSLFAQESVDAVVLDYAMPTMSGTDVAKEMRRMRNDVPILLLSAYVNLPPEVVAVVDLTILKGDGPEVLLARVREVLPEDANPVLEEK